MFKILLPVLDCLCIVIGLLCVFVYSEMRKWFRCLKLAQHLAFDICTTVKSECCACSNVECCANFTHRNGLWIKTKKENNLRVRNIKPYFSPVYLYRWGLKTRTSHEVTEQKVLLLSVIMSFGLLSSTLAGFKKQARLW